MFRRFRDLRIGLRLAVLVGLMALLVGSVVALGHHGMARINGSLQTVYEDRTLCLVQLGAVERDWFRIRVRVMALLNAPPADETQRLRSEITATEGDIEQTWRAYMATYMPAEEQAIAAEIATAMAAYRDDLRQVLDLLARDQLDEARTVSGTQGQPHFLALDAALAKNIALQERIARQEYENGRATFHSTSRLNLALSALGLAFALAVAVLIVVELTRAIRAMVAAMNALAGGDVATDIPGCDRRDELGAMAQAVEVFKLNAVERLRLEEQERVAVARREARRRKMEDLTAAFDDAITALLSSTGAAVLQMNGTAEGMMANAEQTQRQAATVSAATEQASANVSTIASASNEMLASIHEIGTQVSRSAAIAADASAEADATNRRMVALAQTAARIGEVVTMITDIASQTNLLALNATIEAARAGEAGKGFAVVAGEVKTLANQTARATEEISAQISAIQHETAEAVQAIGRITAVVGDINEMTATIAGAVEEQGAAMQEVVRNVEEAALGTRDVAASICQVVTAAQSTSDMVTLVRAAAGAMDAESCKLRDSVETFLGGVKAA